MKKLLLFLLLISCNTYQQEENEYTLYNDDYIDIGNIEFNINYQYPKEIEPVIKEHICLNETVKAVDTKYLNNCQYSIPENTTNDAYTIWFGDSRIVLMYMQYATNFPSYSFAICSSSSVGVVNRLENLLSLKADGIKIKNIIIQIGIADVFHTEQFQKSYLYIKEFLNANFTNTKIIIGDIVTSDSITVENYNKLLKYNKWLKDFCYNNNWDFVEINPLLDDNTNIKEEYNLDGIHFTCEAHRIIYEKYLNIIGGIIIN